MAKKKSDGSRHEWSDSQTGYEQTSRSATFVITQTACLQNDFLVQLTVVVYSQFSFTDIWGALTLGLTSK